MTTKAGAIKYWKARRARYAFVRRRLKKILSLSQKGWAAYVIPDYIDWLDIVYLAKERGLYSYKTANSDVILNLRAKAK